jgi:predicted nucleotidyltransferase
MDPLDPLPAPYRALYDRAVAVLGADERVRALWLGGSVARGVADAGSDLDLVVAVRDADLGAFRAGHREWLDAIAPTVLVRLADTYLHCVTATGERLDVVIEPASGLPETPFRDRLPVLDRDGLHALLPAPEPPRGPDVAAMTAHAEEFLRMQAVFPAAVVAREDWLLGVVGVHDNQRLLYALFAEANQPLPAMGQKQWSARLTHAQRAVLAALPPPAADRDSVVAAMRATAAAWRTHGRAALEAAGGEWPHDLDAAVRAYWARAMSG